MDEMWGEGNGKQTGEISFEIGIKLDGRTCLFVEGGRGLYVKRTSAHRR